MAVAVLTQSGSQSQWQGLTAPGKSVKADVWTSGNKVAIGAAYDAPASPIWFTSTHGALTDVLYPTVDQDNLRQFGYLVTDGRTFVFDESSQGVVRSKVTDDRAPIFEVSVEDPQRHFRLIHEFAVDPQAPAVLERTRFIGDAGLHVYGYLVPHLLDNGASQSARFDTDRAYVSRADRWLAVADDSGMDNGTAGYLRVNDGYEQLKKDFRLTARYRQALKGRVSLTWEVRRPDRWTVALAMGESQATADFAATASLKRGFDQVLEDYRAGWRRYAATLDQLGGKATPLYFHSAEAIKMAEDKQHPGAIVASLALPWGNTVLDQPVDVGYRKVWPRDLYHAASGLLAAGDQRTALDVLAFMRRQQSPNGSLFQNTDLNGAPIWPGDQLDETADAILLGVRLADRAPPSARPDLAAAADYIVNHGPITGQERWEENAGYSPATIATEIAALRAAAGWAKGSRELAARAAVWRATADAWDRQLEGWTYSTRGPLGPRGYYLRITANGKPDSDEPLTIANNGGAFDQRLIVDPSFLELVRLGIRPVRDPRVLNSLEVIDSVIRRDAAGFPMWYRYPHDGYGERAAGEGFPGTGHLWPLLAGERGIYTVLAGGDASPFVKELEALAGPEQLISEQIWEGSGEPTGSARPLVWAHAEYIILLRATLTGRVDDQPRP
jgi:glucoamylase